MVPGIPLKGPPRPPARRLLPLPLLLLAVMAGKSRADMGCRLTYDDYDYYLLNDPSKCWVTEINAAFNGKLDRCDSVWVSVRGNAVSRMRVRSAQCAVCCCCVCNPSFSFRLSPRAPLFFSNFQNERRDCCYCLVVWDGKLRPQVHSSTPCALKEGHVGTSKPSQSAAFTLPAPASIANTHWHSKESTPTLSSDVPSFMHRITSSLISLY